MRVVELLVALYLAVCSICSIESRLLADEIASEPVSEPVTIASIGAGGAPVNKFNVLNFGAKADGKTDDTKAFSNAWKAACGSSGMVQLIIPSGKYFLGPIQFYGPCRKVKSLTFILQGTLKASTDLSKYGNDWIEFCTVHDLTVTGGGTFDGQGSASWPFNKCPVQKNCKVLPTNVLFVNANNTLVQGITSLNSKFFHLAVLNSHNFRADRIKIVAPGNSPNTDGIHIESNNGLSITNSEFSTGDDCISIGQGNRNVRIQGVKCGPGHGLSIGSLGKYKGEGDVKGIFVSDVKFTGTMNGLRIKTWQNSPSKSVASNMTFQNLVMKDVGNPIIIDQKYCPYSYCEHSVPSSVKISDIHFKDISGTSTTPVAVVLKCGMPCENVSLHNVNLRYTGPDRTTANCLNVKAKYTGVQNPPPCL